MSQLTLHPLLAYSQHDIVLGHCCSILWDLREPPALAVQHVTALGVPLSPLQLAQHATLPPLPELHITCGFFPEEWPITAHNQHGVTVLDVLQAIHICLQAQLRHEEWNRFSRKQRDRVSAVFDARWHAAPHPMAAHDYGVLRADCLLRHTWFAGLAVSLESGANDTCLLTLRIPR